MEHLSDGDSKSTHAEIAGTISKKQKIWAIVASVVVLAGCVGCFIVAGSVDTPSEQQASDNPTIRTVVHYVPDLGTLEGRHMEGAIQFYGVPYAKQPERWMHAEYPPDAFAGVRPAYQPETSAPICYQDCYGATGTNDWVPGCQDMKHESKCLYLQISVPERLILNPTGEKLPVWIYLHGGNFVFGSGHTPLYEGRYLAAQGDMVVVSANYRLKEFGFMPIDGEWNGKPTVGNFGITDQQRALQFLYDYIGHFGGDNTRVTLAGQSAGSESTLINLLNKDSPHQKYFQQAMMMSVPSLPYLNSEQAKTNMLPAVLDAANDKTGCHEVSCLYDISAEDMHQIARTAEGMFFSDDYNGTDIRGPILFSMAQMYDPIIDGNIMTDQQTPMAVEKLDSSKAIMVGSTADEGEIFVIGVLDGFIGDVRLTPLLYNQALKIIWKHASDSPEDVAYRERLLAMYPFSLDCNRFHPEIYPDPSDREINSICDGRDAANHAVRDYLFVCSQRKFLEEAVKKPIENPKNLYFWNFDEPVPWLPPQEGKSMRRCANTCTRLKPWEDGNCGLQYGMACHGGDISYVFQSDESFKMVGMADEYRRMSRTFMRYISNFARNGDPNDDSGRVKNEHTAAIENLDAAHWKAFSMENRGYLRFTMESEVSSIYEDDPQIVDRYGMHQLNHTAACDMWDDIDEYTEH